MSASAVLADCMQISARNTFLPKVREAEAAVARAREAVASEVEGASESLEEALDDLQFWEDAAREHSKLSSILIIRMGS